jgi:membrane-bound metal-dependent hydrolase YbcI (DUF457 family)
VDNLTHSLFAVTLARAGLGRGVPYATATLVLASNAPDADVVMALGGGVAYLAAHRGPTHGPLGVVGLGLVTAGIVWAWARWRGRGRPAEAGDAAGSFARWTGLAIVGVVGHVLMDLPTVYATRLLSPFSGTWFAFDWMPIIDVYLWIALIGALAAGRLPARRRRAALVGLALLVLDYAARAALHQRALAQGAAFDAGGAPAPCATAPVLVAHRGPIDARGVPPGACVTAAALPTFGSPFRWRIVRQSADGYELSDRSVLAPAAPLAATRLTSDAGPEITRVRATRAGRVYYDFARFPIARVVSRTPAATVRLLDARFIGLPSNDALGDLRAGLTLTVTVDPSSRGRVNPPAPVAP